MFTYFCSTSSLVVTSSSDTSPLFFTALSAEFAPGSLYSSQALHSKIQAVQHFCSSCDEVFGPYRPGCPGVLNLLEATHLLARQSQGLVPHSAACLTSTSWIPSSILSPLSLSLSQMIWNPSLIKPQEQLKQEKVTTTTYACQLIKTKYNCWRKTATR